MYRVVNLICIHIICAICSRDTSIIRPTEKVIRLTAVHYSTHSRELYEKLRNENLPPEVYQTGSYFQMIQQTCNDITGSGFFQLLNLTPNDTRRIYRNLSFQGYGGFFDYSSGSESSDELSPRKTTSSPHFEKQIQFVCLFNDSPEDPLSFTYPYYVSREYNVGQVGQAYKPGRFVFGPGIPGRRKSRDIVMLAEEPGIVYTNQNFNVEMYYLRMRKYILPAKSNHIDPLCRWISIQTNVPNNRHYRFCVAVSRSSDFKDDLEYPRPAPYPCNLERISFKTPTGMKEADGRTYYERMTKCYSIEVDKPKENNFLYISRAYASNQLLVYRRDPSDGNMYLVNLTTNVSITDELNSFDFVEE